jgi:hypothetical protein
MVDTELRTLEQAVQFAKQVADANTLGITESHLRKHLDRVIESLADAKATNPTLDSLDESGKLSEDIVERWIDPDRYFELDSKVWFEYRAWSETEDKLFHFEGWHDIARRVQVLFSGRLHVLLASGLGVCIASPILTKDDSRRDEIKVDDNIVLMGQYLIIVSTGSVRRETGSSPPPMSFMKRFMKILYVDNFFETRQGKKHMEQAKAKANAHSIFC